MVGKLVSFLKEARKELKKVSWPSRKQAARLTMVVIGASAAAALFVGVIDYILTRLVATLV